MGTKGKKVIGSVEGRNGLFDITSLHLWTGTGGKVYIEGVGKRSYLINGGFYGLDPDIALPQFAGLLKSCGWSVEPPAKTKGV